MEIKGIKKRIIKAKPQRNGKSKLKKKREEKKGEKGKKKTKTTKTGQLSFFGFTE